MEIQFEKYQGAGNDFIIIDNRSSKYSGLKPKHISSLCNRNFGIGADGFIMVEESKEFDFEMNYFNADGKQSTLCGNGGRCAVLFVFNHGISGKTSRFFAADGLHTAEVASDTQVCLTMSDVAEVISVGDDWFVDTGSPHHIVKVKGIAQIDVNKMGASIRYEKRYAPDGTNVNFVEPLGGNHFSIRTYERGVENETLACGTGAVAAAICMHHTSETTESSIQIDTFGGTLQVDFNAIENGGYQDIRLTGPAAKVFSGSVLL